MNWTLQNKITIKEHDFRRFACAFGIIPNWQFKFCKRIIGVKFYLNFYLAISQSFNFHFKLGE